MGRAVAPGPAGAGGRAANGAVLLIKLVQVLAEQLHELHAEGAVLAQVAEKTFPRQKSYLAGLQGFHGGFVGGPGHGFAQAQHGAGAGYVQSQAGGALVQQKPDAPFLEEKNPAHGTPTPVHRRALPVLADQRGGLKGA